METEEQSNILEVSTAPQQPVGIYGWRKRCLYGFLLALMVVIIINLALTVWILRVLDFSLDGMGRLRIVPKGFRLQGEAEFLRPVYVNKVKSEEGKALYLQSNKAVKLFTTNHKNKITSKMVVDTNRIVAECDTFVLEDSKGNKKLLITDKEVILGSGDVVYNGSIKFESSVFTPSLRGPTDRPLEIRSETSRVHVSGKGGVSACAESGDVILQAMDNIIVEATSGAVYVKSQKVVLTGIPKADASSVSYVPNTSGPSLASTLPVYQLCVCESGRLFLGLPSGDCRSSSTVCFSP